MKKVAAACLILVLSAFLGRADIIYFKDGLKTICQEKTWEEDGEVKCEYGGWIITYQKSDILRILKTTSPGPTVPSPKKPKVKKKIEPAQALSKKTIPPTVRGLKFYDPQRPEKYWTDKNTRHESYNDAIEALARKYDRSPEWIQANMGQTNDLAEIHRNLAKQKSNPTKTMVMPPVENHPSIEFYNPGRPFPYWTDVSTKHKTYREAIQALARKYGQSEEVVQKAMGQKNNLSEIHRNLQNFNSAEF